MQPASGHTIRRDQALRPLRRCGDDILSAGALKIAVECDNIAVHSKLKSSADIFGGVYLIRYAHIFKLAVREFSVCGIVENAAFLAVGSSEQYFASRFRLNVGLDGKFCAGCIFYGVCYCLNRAGQTAFLTFGNDNGILGNGSSRYCNELFTGGQIKCSGGR